MHQAGSRQTGREVSAEVTDGWTTAGREKKEGLICALDKIREA